MKKTSILLLVILMASTMSLFSAGQTESSVTKPIVLKYAHVGIAGEIQSRYVEGLADLVKEKTDGAVIIHDNKIKAAFEAYKSVNSLTTRSAGATVNAQFVANAGVTLSQLLLASETNPSALLASDTLAALMTQFELTELAHVTLQGVITLNADAENAAEGFKLAGST